MYATDHDACGSVLDRPRVISIAVPTYREADNLALLAEALLAHGAQAESRVSRY